MLDHPGHEGLVTLARRLADNPALSETARRAVAVWLSDAEDMVDARTAFLERRVTLRRLVAEAEARRREPPRSPRDRPHGVMDQGEPGRVPASR